MNSYKIKQLEKRLTKKMVDGSYEFPTTPALTALERQADDMSDFEDANGTPTALYIIEDEKDEEDDQKSNVIVIN
ncbi:hypothetical protein V7S43_018881 [Phytophthora oleae]|uniref:Uncharacterized protein n=1 Tax=Phytophthora oleae TaxID=2107226 RepID=A0ABD3EQ13_9STRA